MRKVRNLAVCLLVLVGVALWAKWATSATCTPDMIPLKGRWILWKAFGPAMTTTTDQVLSILALPASPHALASGASFVR